MRKLNPVSLKKRADEAIKNRDRAECFNLLREIDDYKKNQEGKKVKDKNYGEILVIEEDIRKFLEVKDTSSAILYSLRKYFPWLATKRGLTLLTFLFGIALILLNFGNSFKSFFGIKNTPPTEQTEPPKTTEPEPKAEIDLPKPPPRQKTFVVKNAVPNALLQSLSKKTNWTTKNKNGQIDFSLNFHFDPEKLTPTSSDQNLYFFDGGNLICTINNQTCQLPFTLSSYDNEISEIGLPKNVLEKDIKKEINSILNNKQNFEGISNAIKKCIN